MNQEEYNKYKEAKQELPSDEMVEDEESEEESEERENKPRRRIRHYKKEEVMLQECERYVMERKRLPKLHSRWIVSRYVNEHMFTLQSVPYHNRMVDDLREANMELYRLRKRVQELEAMVTDEQIVKAVREAFLAYLAADSTLSHTIEEIVIEGWDTQKGEVSVRVVWTYKGAEPPSPDDALYTVSIVDGEIVDVFGPEW